MNSIFILNRLPVIGFNSESRLDVANKHTPKNASCISKKDLSGRIFDTNMMKLLGCIPIVSAFVGIHRIYTVWANSPVYTTFETEQQQADLQNLKIKIALLGMAEICQLSGLLLVVHLAATIFDHAIVLATHLNADLLETLELPF